MIAKINLAADMPQRIGLRGNSKASRFDWEKFLNEQLSPSGDLNTAAVASGIQFYTANHEFHLKVTKSVGDFELYTIGSGFLVAFSSAGRRLIIFRGNTDQTYSFTNADDKAPVIFTQNLMSEANVVTEMRALFKKGACTVEFMENHMREREASILESVSKRFASLRFDINMLWCVFIAAIVVFLVLIVGMALFFQRNDARIAEQIAASSTQIGTLETANSQVKADVGSAVGLIGKLNDKVKETTASYETQIQLIAAEIEAQKQANMEVNSELKAVNSDLKAVKQAVGFILTKYNQTTVHMIGDGKENKSIGSELVQISQNTGLSAWDTVCRLCSFAVTSVGTVVSVVIGIQFLRVGAFGVASLATKNNRALN